ncbi:hypothetical protein [uncultured Thiocystis sp.]|uniref:hypothetical protein n=1 Tax=uncultured Thiocystis sp. TaxID=1202134 RepID=UPI0025D197CF|nr:hypothetical protein [uncultured Thiocystis sp.]
MQRETFLFLHPSAPVGGFSDVRKINLSPFLEINGRLRLAIRSIGVGVDLLADPWHEFERRLNWRISPVIDAVRSDLNMSADPVFTGWCGFKPADLDESSGRVSRHDSRRLDPISFFEISPDSHDVMGMVVCPRFPSRSTDQ